MNKKGFTLVELLAVIAILAILVIIALPNVLETYKEAKKAAFVAEARNIYKAAQQQWLLDSMGNNSEVFYARCDGCQSKELTLNGREEIDYFIQLDPAGNVLNFFVTDGTFQTAYVGLFGDNVVVNELNYADEISELDDGDIFSILDVETEAYENYDENNGGQNSGCEPGYYLNESTSSCEPCPSGTYKSDYGNHACTSCSANMCSSEGAIICRFCGGTITPINPPIGFDR